MLLSSNKKVMQMAQHQKFQSAQQHQLLSTTCYVDEFQQTSFQNRQICLIGMNKEAAFDKLTG